MFDKGNSIRGGPNRDPPYYGEPPKMHPDFGKLPCELRAARLSGHYITCSGRFGMFML